MTRNELLDVAQRDMREKAAWAARELEAMRQLEADLSTQQHQILFQDRFWSFLSAGRMLWFYLGRLCDSWPPPKPSAATIIDHWLQGLGPEARRTWDTLAELRKLDVHTTPVDVAPQRVAGGIMRVGGRLARVQGGLARVSIIRGCVAHNGQVLQCVPFAVASQQLLEALPRDLPSLMRPHE